MTELMRALKNRNVKKARDLVTLLVAANEEEKIWKRNAYRSIVSLALRIGDIDAAREALPFADGYEPDEQSLASFIAQAVERGKLEAYILCKEWVDADIYPKELARLLRKMKDKVQANKFLTFMRFQTTELNLVKSMLERIHPNELTLEERVVIRLKT